MGGIVRPRWACVRGGPPRVRVRLYIAAFNAQDYGALETFFADDFALENAGFRVEGKLAFRAFYAFFHEYCR